MSQEVANTLHNIWEEIKNQEIADKKREAHDLSFTWRAKQAEHERQLAKHDLEVSHLQEQISKLKADGVKDYITTIVVILSLVVNIVLANHIIG